MYHFCYKSVFFRLNFLVHVFWLKKNRNTIFVVEKYITNNFFGYIFFIYITLDGQGVSKGEPATQVAGTLPTPPTDNYWFYTVTDSTQIYNAVFAFLQCKLWSLKHVLRVRMASLLKNSSGKRCISGIE